jgi:hypothetical protein
MVGVTGFEPVTLRLSSACSNQLSYTPLLNAECKMLNADFAFRILHFAFKMLVELRRFELLTYSLQSYRSTN